MRAWYERLAERRRLVRYDPRGTGLSDRSRSDYSVEALTLELEAVVDQLELERFALFAPAGSGPAAIAYAVQHPERVSQLWQALYWTGSSILPRLHQKQRPLQIRR